MSLSFLLDDPVDYEGSINAVLGPPDWWHAIPSAKNPSDEKKGLVPPPRHRANHVILHNLVRWIYNKTDHDVKKINAKDIVHAVNKLIKQIKLNEKSRDYILDLLSNISNNPSIPELTKLVKGICRELVYRGHMEPEVYRKLLLTVPTSREHRAIARRSRARPSHRSYTNVQVPSTLLTSEQDGKATSIKRSRELYDAVLRNDRKTVANLINLRTNISRRFGRRNETPLDAARRLNHSDIASLFDTERAAGPTAVGNSDSKTFTREDIATNVSKWLFKKVSPNLEEVSYTNFKNAVKKFSEIYKLDENQKKILNNLFPIISHDSLEEPIEESKNDEWNIKALSLAKQIKEWGYISDEVLKSLIGERLYNEYIDDYIQIVGENDAIEDDSPSDNYEEVLVAELN